MALVQDGEVFGPGSLIWGVSGLHSIAKVEHFYVPRKRGDGLKRFFWPRQRYKDEDHIREVQGAVMSCHRRGQRRELGPKPTLLVLG